MAAPSPLGNNLKQTGNSRMEWLDALRALAMLFVMYGHLHTQNEFFVFANPIKIPLFFAISGYLMCGKTESTKAFLSRMLQKVIVPWLILSLGFGLRFVLTQGPQFYVNYVAEVLVGKRTWYIVCCILAQVLFYFLQKLFGDGWKLGITIVAATAVGLTLATLGIGEQFRINTALTCQFYLLIGYWIKKHESKLQSIKLWMMLGMLGIYVALAIGSRILFPGRALNVQINKYYNIPYCFLMIAVGCVTVFTCARHIKTFPRWLCFIGQNTLIFYIHAGFWTNMVERGFLLLGITVPKNWYGALVWLPLICIGCAFEAYIINWIFPEANGKKRKKKAVEAI